VPRRSSGALLIGGVVAALASTLLPRVAGAASAPGAVTNFTASVSEDQAVLTWTPPVGGGVGRYEISAWLAGADYGQRLAPAAATSLTWDRLPFNTPVQFQIVPYGPDDAGGDTAPNGPATMTTPVEALNGFCPPSVSGDCVVADPTQAVAPETHVGAGVLDSVAPAGNALVSALGLTSWRVAAGAPTDIAGAASYVGSSNLIEILSDAWIGHTAPSFNGYAEAPWGDWAGYTTFIQQTVSAALAAGQHPYWDIQNEPDNYAYDPHSPPNRTNVEQQYLVAYNAIKAVDPNAKIVGPSIDWVYEDPAKLIDMETFIPFAAANGLKFTALSWHDNGHVPGLIPQSYPESPQVIRDHAQMAEELIAENPGIGSPVLFANENSSQTGGFIPGFAAGYLAEDQRAGLAEANRSCWAYPGAGSDANYCIGPRVSDLLNPDGSPSASYWVYADLAKTNGTRVWSESNDTNLSVLAVTDSSSTTRVLLGRHQTCSWWTLSAFCPPPPSSPPWPGFSPSLWESLVGPAAPPGNVATTVNVLLPGAATAATVAIQEIPNTIGDVGAAPATFSSNVTAVAGMATFTIPAIGDGEAYSVTVVPNATGPGPGGPPPGPTPSSIAALSGGGQSTPVLNAFPQKLSAVVFSQSGQPLSGATVLFTLPAGVIQFAGGGNTAQVVTDSRGIAMSPTMIAELTTGTFTATASIPGAPAAGYALTVML
jgi:hypothetical protein